MPSQSERARARAKANDPGTIAGRVKQSVGEMRKHFAGLGARRRQDHYDQIIDEAEIGRRRSAQSTDDSN
jgi:hypothetical protein